MKRALLVTAGTVAGLVSVLAYSPLDPATAVLSEGSGSGAGLGAPPAASPVAAAGPDAASAAPQGTDGSGSSTPAAGPAARSAPRVRPVAHPRAAARARATSSPVAPSSSAVPSTRSSSAPPAPNRVVTRRSPTRTPSSSPRPPAPRPTHPTTPVPKPTPAGPRDYTGSAVTYKYGTLQVAIRVVAGRITDAWAVTYPQGPSQPYSEMAIPILRQQTISAQSAHISGATGASLTSTSWITSLSAALTAAGLR